MTTNAYQPPVTGGAGNDTNVSSLSPTTNFDAGGMTVGELWSKFLGQYYARGLIDWDASDISAGSTVTAATIDLNVTTADSSGHTMAIYRNSRTNWAEATATWNTYDGTNNWTIPGGDIAGTKFTFTSPTSTGAFNIASGAALVAIIQDAIDNRSGIVRTVWRHDSEAGGNVNEVFAFDDSENGTAGNRPKLTVTFDPPGGGATRRRFAAVI